MTSSSIALGPSTAVLAFSNDFISEKADYTRPNFFAEMLHTPDDKYGAFPLVTATKVGKGSIVICSESTIFSNFAIFEPNVLGLVDLLFSSNDIASLISKYSVLLLTLSILLLSTFRVFPSIMGPCALILMLIVSKAFYFYKDSAIDFYKNDNILVIDSDDKYVLDPYFEHMDSSNTSCSYLLSAIPRYGLYPYYIKGFFMEPKAKLFIGETKTIKELEADQKILSPEAIEASNRIVPIKENVSDYKMGNWWTQIGVSPYRKDRIKGFVEWIKYDKAMLSFEYPRYAKSSKVQQITLKNDNGETKEINIPLDALEALAEGECLLIEEGIWAQKSKIESDIILVGGDSFNDKRNVPFFSRYWYGVISK